ncbi:MAG: NBR1-Ig-like domain-containing protein, partial [Armatimonadota bacterium]|nr:NBR1-Ig-like domain-containing protein [Armatimonadota bacterium]
MRRPIADCGDSSPLWVRLVCRCFGSSTAETCQRFLLSVFVFVLLWLPGAVMAQNNAQYVSDTIPATMVPGLSYAVSVTMSNSGTSTWTKATSYRLGAVGDSDPFAPGRIDLADADSIPPGQQKTFSFTMNAPGVGVYTTDWRMLREGVQWFGDTLTKQVQVTWGPNLPATPTVTSPARGAILGSNRVDIEWVGDPHDAYEVHISSTDNPAAADGWNSGQVWVSGTATATSTAESGPLLAERNYYIFVRVRNGNGWSAWSAYNHRVFTSGQLLNDPYYVAGNGSQWQHTMCYNPNRNEYLIAYMDAKPSQRSVISYYRLDSTGAKIGGEVSVSDNLEGAGGPHVCYNTARQEYLIAYGGYTSSGGLHDELRLQRLNAITGALIGGSNWVVNLPGAFNNNIAYSPTSDSYLLIWDSGYDIPCPLYATRLNSTAVPVGGIFHVSVGTYRWAGNPSICYNSANNEFFVTWQAYYEPQPDPVTWWDYYARGVRASDGALMGSEIVVSATLESDCNGDAAYDSDLNRYLVIYEGGDPSPYGQFISAAGSLVGSRFVIGGGVYQGGMPGIAWSPITKEYLATWASCCSSSNYGRRLTQTGAFIGEPFRTNGSVIGIGNWDPMAVVNTANGEFLIYWFCGYDNIYVRRYKSYPVPPTDTTPPGPVTSFTATSGDTQNVLNWTNPTDPDFIGTIIVFKTTGYPLTWQDGTALGDFFNTPGSSQSYTHTGLTNGVTHYYSAFSHDFPN